MQVTVRIPTPLRSFTEGQEEIKVTGDTIDTVLSSLFQQYQDLSPRICDAEGQLRRFVNIYLNERDIRNLDGLQTPVCDGDTLAIIPAVAGGF